MRILFALLFIGSSVVAQDKTGINSFKFHSALLNEDRFFDVYIPPSPGKLEVIYVLDGQAQFNNVVNTLKQLNQTKQMVVGLGNIWLRDRDYTPTHVNRSMFVDSMAAKVSGGGEKFIAHLEKELIPYIQARYPADTSRTIIGHSLGGLIAMEMMLDHPGLFDKYILIDPSIWWDDSSSLERSKQLFPATIRPAKLFLAIANTRNKDMSSIEAIKKDASRNTAQTRPTVLLLDYLKTVFKDSLQFSWKYYPEEDHMSVFQPAVKNGLSFILK